MNSYQDLVSQVIFDLADCSPKNALLALRQAGRDFCKATNIWVENISVTEKFSVHKKNHEINAVGDSFIQRIITLQINGDDIPKMHYRLTDDWSFEFSEKFLKNNYGYEHDEIVLQVQLRPRFDADLLSQNFLQRYAEPLIAKARSILLTQQNKPYFNLELAKEHKASYNDWIESSCLTQCSGNNSENMTVEQLGNLW